MGMEVARVLRTDPDGSIQPGAGEVGLPDLVAIGGMSGHTGLALPARMVGKQDVVAGLQVSHR